MRAFRCLKKTTLLFLENHYSLIVALFFFSRPTIKQLLNHEFFEDPGFALELCNRDAVLEQREHMVTFRLRFTDPKKQGDKIKVLRKLLPQPFFVVLSVSRSVVR